jgi:hypothetical protein
MSPGHWDACYPYSPATNSRTRRAIGVPYRGQYESGFDTTAVGRRTHRMLYYAKFHGKAVPLRARLFHLLRLKAGQVTVALLGGQHGRQND